MTPSNDGKGKGSLRKKQQNGRNTREEKEHEVCTIQGTVTNIQDHSIIIKPLKNTQQFSMAVTMILIKSSACFKVSVTEKLRMDKSCASGQVRSNEQMLRVKSDS